MLIAIGGHVIKTARDELLDVIKTGKVEMLIHNGASVFHDFQLVIDDKLSVNKKHSFSLEELINNPELNREASEYVWDWLIHGKDAPHGSVTRYCDDNDITTLMFTIPGADFWNLFNDDWGQMGDQARVHFSILQDRLKKSFHYVCMGSAVVHPEIFIKALAGSNTSEFRADVVDFLDMYRPRTRIAKYGKYYKMTHKKYLNKLLKGKLSDISN